MKKLLIAVGIAHLLAEGLGGLMMVIAPASVLPGASSAALSFVVLYGFAAIAMASVVVWAWPQRNNAAVMGVVLGILATFHTGILLGLLMAAMAGGSLGVGIVHGMFAALFWLLYARRRQWCAEPLSR